MTSTTSPSLTGARIDAVQQDFVVDGDVVERVVELLGEAGHQPIERLQSAGRPSTTDSRTTIDVAGQRIAAPRGN